MDRFQAKAPYGVFALYDVLLRRDIHLRHDVTLMWSFEVLHRGVFPSDPRSLESLMTVLEDKLNNRTREWVRRKALAA